MKKYALNTIVVPWDFSPLSKLALEGALEMAKSPDQIEVIHVTPYPAASEYSMVWGDMSEVDIQGQLSEAFERDRQECDFPAVNFTVQFGDAGIIIAQFAKNKQAGLIVISSHGHTGLSRMLLGSVAERVVRLSPCSVLVLRGGDNQ